MTKTKIIAAACTALALSFGTVAVAPANAKTMHKHMTHKKKGMMRGNGMSSGGMQGGGMSGGGMQGGQGNGM